MRFVVALVIACGLTGCTASEDEKAKEQARQTGNQIRHDAHEAVQEVKAGTEKASREIDKGLRETREKVRKAIDAPPENGHH